MKNILTSYNNHIILCFFVFYFLIYNKQPKVKNEQKKKEEQIPLHKYFNFFKRWCRLSRTKERKHRSHSSTLTMNLKYCIIVKKKHKIILCTMFEISIKILCFDINSKN